MFGIIKKLRKFTKKKHHKKEPGNSQKKLHKLEIRSVKRDICPIATLYSLAAAFQRLTLLWAGNQFCLWIKNSWLPWQQKVIREEIYITPLHSLDRKIAGSWKQRAIILFWSFLSQNSLPRQRGWQRRNLHDTISTGPKIRGRCKQRAIIFHGARVTVNFCPKIRCHGNRGQMTPSDSAGPKIGR